MRFLAGLALAAVFLRLDRIFLAERLPVHEFGLYAAAMQLVDVWLQIAYLIGFGLACVVERRSVVNPAR